MRRPMTANGRFSAPRALLALAGLLATAGLAWAALPRGDLAGLAGVGWLLPTLCLLHLLQQALCGLAWRGLIEPPRPSRWVFFRARWIRASVAALVPVSGVGAALVAVRMAVQAGLGLDTAAASLTLDATMEMLSQIVFTALGFALLLAGAPQPRLFGWSIAALSLAAVMAAAFIAAQRWGALKLVEAGLERLARRLPALSPLAGSRLHERLMQLYRRRRAALVGGWVHLGAWLLGAAEVWLVLVAFGHPAGPTQCVVIESLGMTARSAGFVVPGGLGVQEGAVVAVGVLVGLPAPTAVLLAIVKRLCEVAVAVLGLLLWQWREGRRMGVPPAGAQSPGLIEGAMARPGCPRLAAPASRDTPKRRT
jgi:putative membrane protein